MNQVEESVTLVCLKRALVAMFSLRILHVLIIPVLVFATSSCTKKPAPYPASNAGGDRVLVACEGSLGNGNSALTLFEPDSNRSTEDIFRQANGTPLGDVFQSITRIGEQYFLCINNSDKILVINRSDFKLAGTISIPKPRYIVQVNPGKAYVSTLFSNKIYMIDPQSLLIRGTIDMPFKNPEGMCLSGNKVYVCNWDSACSSIYPIDTGTDALDAAIPVAGKAPQEILSDKNGMLWVLGGNQAEGVEATLSSINPANGSLLRSYFFGKEDPVHPVFNQTKDTLYYLQVSYVSGATKGGVFRMGIQDVTLPSQAFVPAAALQNFWGVAVHPKTGEVYVADPMGFTQRGRVSIYGIDGSLRNSFATGVGPGHILFD